MILKVIVRLKYNWHRNRLISAEFAQYKHTKQIDKLHAYLTISECDDAPVYIEWPPGNKHISAGESRQLISRREAACSHKAECFMSNNTHIRCPDCGRVREIERTDLR